MRKVSFLLVIVHLFAVSVLAQKTADDLTFETIVKHLPVTSQGSTGTCWSFATTSFLESEIIRKGNPGMKLSEMFFVYHTYKNKALQYLLFRGNINMGQGGQAHDVLDVLRTDGLMSYQDFPGKMEDGRYRHRDLSREVKEIVTDMNDRRGGFKAEEIESLNSVLNNHLGVIPGNSANNESSSAVDFREKLKIDPSDYVELTSYNHRPFYQPFVLEVPDNWAHGQYYNLPVDELVEVMVHALENGYSVCWDGDTSESTFSNANGIAYLPEEQKGKVDQALRQETFYNRTTTDDHLMHVVGLSKDEEGRLKIKKLKELKLKKSSKLL